MLKIPHLRFSIIHASLEDIGQTGEKEGGKRSAEEVEREKEEIEGDRMNEGEEFKEDRMNEGGEIEEDRMKEGGEIEEVRMNDKRANAVKFLDHEIRDVEDMNRDKDEGGIGGKTDGNPGKARTLGTAEITRSLSQIVKVFQSIYITSKGS